MSHGDLLSSVRRARRLLAQVAVAVAGVVAVAGAGCGRDALRDPARDSSAGTGGGAGAGGGGDAQGGRGGGAGDGSADRMESGTDVRPGTVTLTLQPSVAPPLPVGQTLQWRAFVLLSGAQRDITGEPDLLWSSSNPAVAMVTERGGRVSGVAPGRADIRAQHPLFGMASVSLQVTPAAVVRLVVEPTQLRLATEEARALSARAVYTDGTESDVTFAAQWMSLDQRVARVGMGAERPGLVTGVAGGDTTVTASFAGAAASARISCRRRWWICRSASRRRC